MSVIYTVTDLFVKKIKKPITGFNSQKSSDIFLYSQ